MSAGCGGYERSPHLQVGALGASLARAAVRWEHLVEAWKHPKARKKSVEL